jgi:hypothetical protein
VNPVLAHASGADETMSLVMLFAGIWVGWIGWSRLRGTGFSRLPRWGAWATTGVAATLLLTERMDFQNATLTFERTSR